MKNFLKQFFKLAFLSFIAVAVLAGAISFSLRNKNIDNVYAASSGESGSTDMTDYAWSENIGWIKFNGSNYGVGIKEIDVGGGNSIGRLSGHAWSENIGWISFNRSDTGAPPASASYDPGNTYGVLSYIDINGQTLQGWARALSTCDSIPCATSGAGINSGGWDGWIRLTKTTVPAYGVTLTPAVGVSSFSGWAWGSDVISGISFNNATGGGTTAYKVNTNFELNIEPNVPTSLNITPHYCEGYLTFNWTFSDPNFNTPNNQQSAYKIDVSYTGFNYSTGKISSGSASANINLNNLGSWYGKTLNWTVTVYDGGAVSKSSSSASTTYGPLSDREYPLVNFSSNPAFDKIFANQDVQFIDGAKCYILGNTGTDRSCSSRSWSIPGATYQSPSTALTQDPIVQFANIATNVLVGLTATDSAGNSCTISKTISNINLPLPEFKEKK